MPGAVTRAKKQQKPIRKVSKRMQSRLAEYRVLRDRYMSAHPWCEGCLWELDRGIRRRRHVQLSTDLHHKRGRGLFLCDVSTFMAMDRQHHDFCKEQGAEAMKRGWILSRLQKD